jgi:HK97 family phage portal protein
LIGGEKLEVKSFFNKLFGSKDATAKIVKLISSSNNYFYPWNGKIFESDIIRSAIRPKANAIGKLAAKHIRGDGELIKVNPDAWMRDILAWPNEYMSMQDFLTKMIFQRELNHNAFAYVERDAMGYPSAIYPVPATSVELKEEEKQLFLKFNLTDGRNMIVPYSDILHLRKDFNDNDFFGNTGTQAIQSLMEVLTTTDQSIINAVKNSAIIKWILKFKAVLKKEDINLQVEEFTKNYLSIENGGTGAAASDPRYDLEQVKTDSFVPNAAQMKETIQRIYSYFGVNDSIVQNKYDENQWNAFYEAEIEPIAIQLSNAFTKVFFSRRERGFGNRIIFETSNLAYASMSTKLALVAMVDRGAMSPNTWREIMNLGPVEGGDDMLRRLDTVTVNEANKKNNKDE